MFTRALQWPWVDGVTKNLTVEKMVDQRLNLSKIQMLGVQAEIKLEPMIFR